MNQKIISSEKNISIKYLKTPELRFLTFDDDWQEVKLKDITSRKKEKNTNLDSNLVLTISAEHGLIDQEKYFNKSVAGKNLKNYYLLEKGDFAYNKSYSSGYLYGVVKKLNQYDRGIVSTLYICFKPNENINSTYLEQYFNSSKWNKELYKIATEGARNHGLLNVGINDFFNTKHKIPISYKEQQKIGDFLSEIDKKISLMEQRCIIIRKSKKMILQHLLPKNISELENKIFQDKWNVKKLDEIAKVDDGVHQTPNYVDSGVKFISVEDIDDFSKSNKFIAKKEYDKYKMKTQKNDIFLTRIGTVGKSNILKENTDYAYYVSLSLIRSNKEINPNYLNQYIKSNIFQRELWKRTLQNASPMKINLIDLKQCLVAFPPIEEQEKISNILNSFDKKIELLNKQIDLMKTYKKGLLQKMFI